MVSICRKMGHVGLRLRLLKQHGMVIAVPYWQGSSTPESMAVDITAALKAKTGLPIDSFRGWPIQVPAFVSCLLFVHDPLCMTLEQ